MSLTRLVSSTQVNVGPRTLHGKLMPRSVDNVHATFFRHSYQRAARIHKKPYTLCSRVYNLLSPATKTAATQHLHSELNLPHKNVCRQLHSKQSGYSQPTTSSGQSHGSRVSFCYMRWLAAIR